MKQSRGKRCDPDAVPPTLPVWHTSTYDGSYDSSSGTGVHWTEALATMQTGGGTGPMVGAGHPGYQLTPPSTAFQVSASVTM